MFRPTPGPVGLELARVHGLRASLNAPALRAEGLPVGPARSVIVLYTQPDGALCLSVAVRSLLTGKLTFFGCDEDLNEFSCPSQLLEAALRFAEGMGFIFDEDLVQSGEPGAHERASTHWRSFTSDSTAADALPCESGDGRDEEAGDELLLVDLADPSDTCEPLSAASERPRLTKFRAASPARESFASTTGAATSPPVARGVSALGRVPIVRRRVAGASSDKPSLFVRLLGVF